MMTRAIVFMFMQCALLVLGAQWDENNDPAIWSASLQYKLSTLPTVGQSEKVPWSDTYWPSFEGGLAKRWQDEEHDSPGFNYTLYTLEQLKSGNVDINLLSPAEKFDLFNSRYDYPLLKSEWQRCHPDDATWEGICHGWTPASIFYEEPNYVTLKNKDGLEIPFGSSDIKALLSYFLAQFAQGQERTLFLGNRCNFDIKKNTTKANNPECADTNAGSFHILLTNMLGLARTGFTCDIDRSIEVWNQPMTRYEYKLGKTSAPTTSSAPGTVKQQAVSLTLYYVKETYPAAIPHKPLILNKAYNYQLDLDADGNILGGSYDKNQWERVDFLWSEEVPAFYGYFKQLDTIYKASISSVARRRLPSPRHRVTLEDYHATTVTNGHIKLSSYNSKTNRAWLVPADADRSTRLHFTFFNTRRFTDSVRVYEVQDGHLGAPIAVLHGSSLPNDIVLRPGVSVLVTFNVDGKAARRIPLVKGTGFELFVQ